MKKLLSNKKILIKGNVDITFITIVLILVSLGLVMLFSASYAYAYYYFNNFFHFISRQAVFALMGLVVMIIVANIDYHILIRFTVPLFAVSIFLLILVLFMPDLNGASRWINLGFITFQPSEIAKFSVILLFSHYISINSDSMKTFKYGVLPFVIVLGIIAFLMVLEPHLSGTVLIFGISAIMMFVGGTSLFWFLLVGGLIVGAVTIVIMIPGLIQYAMSRVQYWLDPFSDSTGKGYQTIQSLYAIGSGGFFGTGIGGSKQKFLFLPEPQNDFVFSVVCEELGFVGAAIIIILFALLVWRGFIIAMKAPDKFGSMLAVGLTAQVGLQAILNIAVVTNTIPNTGISLPFFSYGGTSLMMLLMQMGLILSVSRYSTVEKI
ncbi:MAG: putative lipid II flippase FtsW [Oscillospiraceae bacterium]|nr:putative lipid II flippase FtsW [Oscillospiraceae bacterium]